MILKEKTLRAVSDMLDRENMTAHLHETGIEIEFLWETDRFVVFAPYGYDIRVNDEGYPEVRRPERGTRDEWI